MLLACWIKNEMELDKTPTNMADHTLVEIVSTSNLYIFSLKNFMVNVSSSQEAYVKGGT